MNSVTIKYLKRSTITFAILLTAFLMTGFNSETVSLAASSEMRLVSSTFVLTTTAENLRGGEAKNVMLQNDPTIDDVTFLIYLGRVQAAIGRANSYDKEEGMTNPFTDQVLADYASIDPFVTGKSSRNLSLQPLLSEIASPETFAIIMGQDRSLRDQQNAITVQFGYLIQRVDAIVTERFPSTQASALAMSALYREAGTLLTTALSDEGKILDVSKYRDALNLMEASLRLSVNKVTSCDRSRDALAQLKPRGPLGDLLDRLIIISPAGTIEGTAAEVIEAAESLAQLGASLPADDKQICE